MANSTTPVDVYRIVNAAAKAIFGADTTLQAIDTSTFATVGEAMLRTGYENTLDALSLVMGRTIIAARPYMGKYHSIYRTGDQFGAITRKISFFYNDAEASQDWNTDINPAQLDDGKTIDHYKIRKHYPLELNFVGIKVIQKHYTRFRKQLKIAFRSEADFDAFYRGMLIEVYNELEMMREAESGLLVLNHIAGLYYEATKADGVPSMAINMTAAYNAKFGTTYSSEDLRTAHLKEFLAFFVETVKYTSLVLRRNTVLHHVTPTKQDDAGNTLYLLRHTPRDKQRLMVYAPFWISAEAQVLPEIFNDSYLKLDNYEAIEYWQDINTPAAVSITGNAIDNAGVSTSTGAVSIPYVLGMIYDEDALAISFNLEETLTTPINAAGDYYNTYYHWMRSYNDDLTENGVLFYMADPS